MRQQLVDFVHENKEVFTPFVLSGTIDTHILHMKHDRIWGTQVELQAVATLIQRDVFVLTDCFGGTMKTRWMKYTPLDPTELVYPRPPRGRVSKITRLDHDQSLRIVPYVQAL